MPQEEKEMKYTMTSKKWTITLDTETGCISGDTYQMREYIKDNFTAKWDSSARVWMAENLQQQIDDLKAYLTRVFDLREVEAESKAEALTDRFFRGVCPRCHTYCCGDCMAC